MPHNLIKHHLHQIITGIVKSKYRFESLKCSKLKKYKTLYSSIIFLYALFFLTALISSLCHFVADVVIIRIPV